MVDSTISPARIQTKSNGHWGRTMIALANREQLPSHWANGGSDDLVMTESEYVLRSNAISQVCMSIVQATKDFGLKCRVSEPQICMALEEAIANAVYHGNLEVDSSLKEDCCNKFKQLVEERQKELPWKDRSIRISMLISSLGAWITIRDQGPGFDVRKRLNAAPDPEKLLASGRGLVMMKAFTDELFYNEQGNCVTMVFYGASSRQPAELCAEAADAVM